MPAWAISGALYGVVLLVAALTMPIGRRALVAALCAGYAMTALGAGALPQVPLVAVFAPAVLLLSGYWLSGFFYRDPQAWLERVLLRTDRWVFAALDLDRRVRSSPRWLLELLEAAYVGDYVIVGAGAMAAAWISAEAVSAYWTLVLTSELACYAALPWLRSRPPRVLEGPGMLAERAPTLRRLNEAILDRASVQANTIPSGHVAGAAAAGLALLTVSVWMGTLVLAGAVVIAIAAVVGRYHYIVDCVAAAAVAAVVWLATSSIG
jgi:hypothetical protein